MNSELLPVLFYNFCENLTQHLSKFKTIKSEINIKILILSKLNSYLSLLLCNYMLLYKKTEII